MDSASLGGSTPPSPLWGVPDPLLLCRLPVLIMSLIQLYLLFRFRAFERCLGHTGAHVAMLFFATGPLRKCGRTMPRPNICTSSGPSRSRRRTARGHSPSRGAGLAWGHTRAEHGRGCGLAQVLKLRDRRVSTMLRLKVLTLAEFEFKAQQLSYRQNTAVRKTLASRIEVTESARLYEPQTAACGPGRGSGTQAQESDATRQAPSPGWVWARPSRV